MYPIVPVQQNFLHPHTVPMMHPPHPLGANSVSEPSPSMHHPAMNPHPMYHHMPNPLQHPVSHFITAQDVSSRAPPDVGHALPPAILQTAAQQPPPPPTIVEPRSEDAPTVDASQIQMAKCDGNLAHCA